MLPTVIKARGCVARALAWSGECKTQDNPTPLAPHGRRSEDCSRMNYGRTSCLTPRKAVRHTTIAQLQQSSMKRNISGHVCTALPKTLLHNGTHRYHDQHANTCRNFLYTTFLGNLSPLAVCIDLTGVAAALHGHRLSGRRTMNDSRSQRAIILGSI